MVKKKETVKKKTNELGEDYVPEEQKEMIAESKEQAKEK